MCPQFRSEEDNPCLLILKVVWYGFMGISLDVRARPYAHLFKCDIAFFGRPDKTIQISGWSSRKYSFIHQLMEMMKWLITPNENDKMSSTIQKLSKIHINYQNWPDFSSPYLTSPMS